MVEKKAHSFNVNEYVRVRLTDWGRQILADEWEELRRNYPKVGAHTPPKEDEGGWSKWQLWQLMQHFGPHIRLGMETPFETEIEILL